MTNVITRPSLRQILIIDAVTCIAMGALLTITSVPLGGFLGISATLLFYAGLVLLPVAAFMILVAVRPDVPVEGALVVVAGNVLWVLASIVLLAGSLITPNGLGVTFVVLQAAAVAVLAVLEYVAIGHERAGVPT